VSGEGVQRDLLPILEGSTVHTRYGPVRTDHVLFIAAGAFTAARPSDLIPEFQGRFPIRVELKALSEDDLVRILTEPGNALTRQYAALLGTEGVSLDFTPDGVRELAAQAHRFNEEDENLGARRLFTALVANTENGGGGMKLMPGAKPDDGILDLIEMGDVSRLGMLFGVMPKLYSGAHVHHPKVRTSRGTSFRFESDVETLVDLDGETVGRLPLDVSVLPRAFLVGTVS